MTLAPLHKRYPAARIAIVSASERKDDVLDAIAAGLSGYIPKSLPSNEFIKAVEMVMEGMIYVPGLMMAPDLDAEEAFAWLPSGSISRHRNDVLAKLTPRQKDVLECIRKGLSNREIGDELGISSGTVKIHVAALMAALSVNNRVQLASAQT